MTDSTYKEGLPMDYWDKQEEYKKLLPKGKSTREQAYIKVLENSAVSFKDMWEKEKTEREMYQKKYKQLIRKIKTNTLKEVNKANGDRK